MEPLIFTPLSYGCVLGKHQHGAGEGHPCNEMISKAIWAGGCRRPVIKKEMGMTIIKSSAREAPAFAVADAIPSSPAHGATELRQKDEILKDVEEMELAFWDYQTLFMCQRSETGDDPLELRVVEGSVPGDIVDGTYYLGGPGLFADDHGSFVHPLDGHGYIRRFIIRSQSHSVLYSARYIETQAREEEYDQHQNRWRFKYRGPFSVLRGGRRIGNVKVMKNVANTSVLNWGGRLMCLWEGGDPYRLDSRSLSTVGVFSLASNHTKNSTAEYIVKGEKRKRSNLGDLFRMGALQMGATILQPILSGVFKMPEERMLSHYKIDAKRQRLIVMTCHAEDMVLPKSNFNFYEFDSSMNLLQKRRFIIHDHLMIHDWALTEHHYIVIGNRIKLDIAGSVAAMSGMTSMISALSLNPSNPHTPLYLLPRFSDGERDWRVAIKLPRQFWLMHTANAYEEMRPDGILNIVVQACICSYKWFSFKHMFGYDWKRRRLDPGFMNADIKSNGEMCLPHLVEVSLNLKAAHNSDCLAEVKAFKGWRKACDFPAINVAVSAAKNRYTYVAGCSGVRSSLPHFPFDTIVKLNGEDSSIWWAGKRCFVGEPVFVPRKRSPLASFVEDDGYILVVQYAVWEQRCYLVILDAQHIGEECALVAKLEVPKELSFPLGFHGFWVPRVREH